MNILAVDDEPMVLKYMEEELNKVFLKDKIVCASEQEDAIQIVKDLYDSDQAVAYAFLDIKLRGTTGILLAKKIKDISPATRIIFCTAYGEYTKEAFEVYAVGYLLKPVTAEKIKKVIDSIQPDWRESTLSDAEIKVQTFGKFEIFVDGKPLYFERRKAKELLAYLIDEKGASVTTRQIAAILWEDRNYDRTLMKQVNTIISTLKKTLRNAGIEDLLIKSWNSLSIDRSKIKCDLYDFYAGDALAINSYKGEYMSDYSWAEFTNGDLMNKV